MKSGPKKVQKARHGIIALYTIHERREFVLTATTVTSFCTTFHEIAKEPLSKTYGSSTPYGTGWAPKFGSNKDFEGKKKDQKT